jgi:hypothetical protein
MKKTWDVVSFLAVVNLVALLMFGAWLWRSDRMSVDRVRQIRAVLAPTVAEEETRRQEAEAEAAAEALAAEARARGDKPLPSAAELVRVERLGEQTQQAIRRLQDHAAMHESALKLRSTVLDERETRLSAREQAWEQNIEAELERRIDEQFQKTVALYESLAGKQAKQMLLELVEMGEVDQAVAYLDAMQPRAATKTLREMKTDAENELATELLERIRIFGIEAEVAEMTGDDERLTAANQPSSGSE